MFWGGYGGKATLRDRTILAMLAKKGKDWGHESRKGGEQEEEKRSVTYRGGRRLCEKP